MPLRRLAPLLLAGLVLVLGCETQFEPFDEHARHYSVYGYLDAAADTQYLRVVSTRSTVAVPPELDASVVLTDAASGEAYAWRDSVVRFPLYHGHVAHIFYTALRPTPGRAYRLTVRRSDGATSQADVRVPVAPPDPVVERPQDGFRSVRRRIRWPEAFNVARVEMVYHVRDTLGGAFREVVVPYTEDVRKGAGWTEVVVDLSDDYSAVYQAFDFPPGEPSGRIALRGLAVHLLKASDDWTFVEAGYDLETLALPGVFSNVTGGFGFVGAVVASRFAWVLPPEAVAQLGYTDEQGR